MPRGRAAKTLGKAKADALWATLTAPPPPPPPPPLPPPPPTTPTTHHRHPRSAGPRPRSRRRGGWRGGLGVKLFGGVVVATQYSTNWYYTSVGHTLRDRDHLISRRTRHVRIFCTFAAETPYTIHTVHGHTIHRTHRTRHVTYELYSGPQNHHPPSSTTLWRVWHTHVLSTHVLEYTSTLAERPLLKQKDFVPQRVSVSCLACCPSGVMTHY